MKYFPKELFEENLDYKKSEAKTIQILGNFLIFGKESKMEDNVDITQI